MPQQTALQAQQKRTAKNAAKTEADAKERDFSKYRRKNTIFGEWGTDRIRFTKTGHGFLNMPMFVGTMEHSEALADIAEILIEIQPYKYVIYVNLRIISQSYGLVFDWQSEHQHSH